MSFIQVDQEFVVETDTTVSNTGEDIMRETGENTVPLSNSNKRSMTLILLWLDKNLLLSLPEFVVVASTCTEFSLEALPGQ